MALFGKKNNPGTDRYVEELLGWQQDEMLVVRGKDCRFLYYNYAASRKMDKEQAAVSCRHAFTNRFKNLCQGCPCAAGHYDDKTSEFETQDVIGDIFAVKIKSVCWTDDKMAAMMTLRNITEQRKSERRLYQLAYVDQLTNMPNRRRFMEDFDALSNDIAAHKRVGCVALFDLDHFKAVNDTYGHNTGDIMLRRLTENINAIPEFKDTLYRLGGDEFVILQTGDAKAFASPNEIRNHYTERLNTLLRTYGIPNIELYCTLSMGVAFAPEHGAQVSDLLRKADIALYESKDNGRNQITVFRDIYDKARKFKDLYINIQPVLTAGGKTFGYELAEKSGDQDGEDGVVTLTDFNRTLDALNLEDMDSRVLYFIQYTDGLLRPAVLNNLPVQKFIIQLPVARQLDRRDLNRVLALRKHKYMVALTGVHSASVTPELLRSISFCRFSKDDKNTFMQNRLIAANANVVFIADGVNTQGDFERAKQAGYKLFQGYYFVETPVVSQKTKELDPISANYFRLIKLTSTQDYVDFKEISDIISGDVSLSFKLLKLLNSAAVGLRNVSSISMAVAYLGEDNLKKWVGLLALRGIGEDKPIELVRMSLIRARFGELLAPHLRKRTAAKHLFLLGVLSLLHVAMEVDRASLLADIAVTEEIRDSLLTPNGPYSHMLPFYEHYEYANWEEISRFAEENRLDCQTINECYIAAVKWYNDLVTPQNT